MTTLIAGCARRSPGNKPGSALMCRATAKKGRHRGKSQHPKTKLWHPWVPRSATRRPRGGSSALLRPLITVAPPSPARLPWLRFVRTMSSKCAANAWRQEAPVELRLYPGAWICIFRGVHKGINIVILGFCIDFCDLPRQLIIFSATDVSGQKARRAAVHTSPYASAAAVATASAEPVHVFANWAEKLPHRVGLWAVL
mmetsp:Transcript_135315/g.269983  ORF Transcript_135315/g.269983 Transcript_135315/m.269983 type:complete len:198 (-) Transcript_135315:994-1587(-)